MKNSDFVHLHVHSHYSLLDGLGTPEAIVKRAKELGMEAVAITDHGAMYGAIDLYKAAQAEGIKPIVGVETYVAPRSLSDKISKLDSNPYHLTLFAKDLEGYRNLMKLTSIAFLEGFYYKPRVDKTVLEKYSKGIIAGSACLSGEIPRYILSGDYEGAKKALGEYQDIFGKDDFYLEIQDHPEIPEQAMVNEGVIKLAKQTNTKLIATCDSHYIKKEDREAHDVLICVQTGKTVDEKNRMVYNGDFSIKDPQDLVKAFADTPEALANTKEIADKCNLEIPFEANLLPTYPLPEGKTDAEFLREMCENGIPLRYPKADEAKLKEIHERLDYELSVISNMGFSSYFLIVSDYVRFAKEQGIMVGPGRGSAAGSIVAYLTSIADADPLLYGLLFERFLNPDRHEMPDIDLDFADHRRSEVLDYIVKRYGEEKVAGIITFGTMAARAAVRDTGRALGMPYGEVDSIAKIIPPPVQGRHIPLEKSVKQSAELKEVYQKDPRAKRLLDMAMKLEGTVRHASQHASAFVITKEELTCYVPLQTAQKEGVKQVTQYSMYPVAELGLLKMDFLGLANLTIIERALEIIEAVDKVKIDIHNLPLDDKATFELLGSAQTTGVFQLESSGMKRYIRELKPNSIDDVAVMVALYRPGPMQFIDTYIARKNGKQTVVYPHEMTKKALEKTYGIPVYQEQVMQISRDMAGFTGGEADKLRKAMGKKIAKLMAEMKDKFIKGSMNNGVSKADAEKVFSMLEDFAAYGFNKSHAVCYAMIAYQTAYLKANHKESFMAALLTNDLDDIERIAIEIEECERMGIHVLPPDINESFVDFGVVKESGNIRFGLAAIKNIGTVPAEIIVKERKKNGHFKSFEDFIDRMSKTDVEGVSGRSILNKKILEALAKSGALDSMAERSHVLQGMDIILKRIQETSKKLKSSQIGLFGEVLSGDIEIGKLDLPAVAPASKQDRLAWEKELLGIYISEHPLREIAGKLDFAVSHTLDLLDLNMEGKRVKIGGILTAVKKINTKSGKAMAFASIEDGHGKSEILVFPKLLEENSDLWQPDKILLVTGKISTKDNEIKILADSADVFDPNKIDESMMPEHMVTLSREADEIVEINLNEEPETDVLADKLLEKLQENEYVCIEAKKVYVILPKGTSKEKILKLKTIVDANHGDQTLILAYKKNGHFEFAQTKAKIKADDKFIQETKKLLK